MGRSWAVEVSFLENGALAFTSKKSCGLKVTEMLNNLKITCVSLRSDMCFDLPGSLALF